MTNKANPGRGDLGIDYGLRIIDDLQPQTPGALRQTKPIWGPDGLQRRTERVKQSQFVGYWPENKDLRWKARAISTRPAGLALRRRGPAKRSAAGIITGTRWGPGATNKANSLGERVVCPGGIVENALRPRIKSGAGSPCESRGHYEQGAKHDKQTQCAGGCLPLGESEERQTKPIVAILA